MSLLVFIFFFKIIENKNKHTGAVLYTLQEKILDKENSESLKDRLVEIETTFNKIDGYLFDKESVDTFVGYIEDLGSSVGAEISVRSIDAIKNEKNLMKIKVHSNGSFSSVIKSISLIENMSYKIEVVQVYLNRNLETEEKEGEQTKTILNNWGADITFNIKSSK
ncbi:TPA: hypothetical protein DIC38_00355 [Candidatus Nomurabacteria bacterium]|nr:hypothetical protein [Candidatus Nomurabacteria bacterium]